MFSLFLGSVQALPETVREGGREDLGRAIIRVCIENHVPVVGGEIRMRGRKLVAPAGGPGVCHQEAIRTGLPVAENQ